MITFDQFITAHPAGSRVGDPLLVGNGETASTMYQCVSYVKQYVLEVKGIKIDWPGNAINLWSTTVQALLDICDKIGDGIPVQGDIAVFKTKGRTDYGGTGHVGVATGKYNTTQMEIWEQNGQTGGGTGTGLDAIRTRWMDRSRLAGLLRFKIVPTAPPYTATNIPEKTVTLNKNTYRYGLNHATFNEIDADRLSPAAQGSTFTTSTILHHQCGESYYSQANSGYNVANGFNVKDCDDYVPPAPATPPAAPVPVTKSETYPLKVDLLCYPDPNKALAATTPKGELQAGTYYVWGREKGCINISMSNMHNDDCWIEERKNVIPTAVVAPLPPKITETIKEASQMAQVIAQPVPDPVPPAPQPPQTPAQDWQQVASELAQHLSLFNLDGSPVHYNSNNSRKLFIEDMTGAVDSKTNTVATTVIQPFTRHIAMIGTVDVVEEDGRKIRYVLPAACYGTNKWYLAPLSYFSLDKKTLAEKANEVVEGIYNDIKASEHLTAVQERIKLSIQGFIAKRKKG